MRWVDALIVVGIVVFWSAAGWLASWNEARLRREERAEEWRRERELWELGRPLRERQRLRAELNRWKAAAHDLGFTPPFLTARIAEIESQLTELQAEQIRKMTALAEGASPDDH